MITPTISCAGLRGLARRLSTLLFPVTYLTTAHAAPLLVQQPASQAVYAGETAVFVAQASSTTPIHYQWQVNGTDLSGQTNAILQVVGVSTLQSGGLYTVIATDSTGSVTSGPAKLEVRLPAAHTPLYTWGADPRIPENRFRPESLRNAAGSIFLVALYDTNLSSIWGTDVYTDDSGLAAAAVHAGVLQRGERATLRVRILPGRYSYLGSARNGITSGSYGKWHGSYEFVGLAPSIEQLPTSQARMVGGTATFSIHATGQGTLRYQWSHNDSPIIGATGSSLSFPVSSVAQAGCYSVAVTDDNATVVHTAFLTVLPFTATAPPAGPVSFSSMPLGSSVGVVVTGNTNMGTVYGDGFYSEWTDVAAAAVHAGLLAHGQEGTVNLVRLQSQPWVAGGTGSVSWGAGPAYALLGRAPHVFEPPISQLVFFGQPVRLTFAATDQDNPDFRIQWRRNGTPIPGANSKVLQVPAGTPGERVQYDALVSLPGNPTVTLPAMLLTPSASASYTVATPGEALQYLYREGNLVYVTVTGATEGGSIWGTGVYTSDSHLGMAAVHAGLLSPGQTGQLAVYGLGQCSGFIATSRNGVTSRGYSSYTGIVLGASSPNPQQPFLRVLSPGQFLVEGASGRTCQILASSSMSSGSWVLLATFKATSDSHLWSDPTNPLPHGRFYCVFLP